jgi:hypothetical protein
MRLYFVKPGMGAAGSTLNSSQIQVANMVVAAANAYGVPPQLALAVASHESGFMNIQNPSSTATGPMQLLAGTAQTMGVTDPTNEQQNIDGGVALLAQLLQQYNGNADLALWAYSEGSGTVSKDGGNLADASTQTQGLISYYNTYTPQPGIDLGTTVADVTGTTAATDTGDDSGDDLDEDSGDDSGDDSEDNGSDDSTLYIAAGVVGLLGLALALR